MAIACTSNWPVRNTATVKPAAQTITTPAPAPPTPPPAARLAAAAAFAAAALLAVTPLAAPSSAAAAAPLSFSPADALQLGPGLLPGDLPSAAAAPRPEQAPAAPPPRAYARLVRALAASVRDALDADAEGRPERDVRRRADPAGQRVREFVARWRDDPLVEGRAYHEEAKEAISELGAFYARAGPRAAVTREVRASVLGHLARAEAALPPAEKGLLDF